MSLLSRWIRLCQKWSRLTEAKFELPEQPLALTHTKLDLIRLLDPCRKRLAIPKVDAHAGVIGLCAQYSIDFLQLSFAQPTGTSGALSLRQSGQSFLLVTVNPILDGTGCIAQQSRYLRTSHTLRHQQHAVQSVIIA